MKTFEIFLSVFVSAMFLMDRPEVGGFHWTQSLPNGTVKTVCELWTIHFEWSFEMDPDDERIEQISWDFLSTGRDLDDTFYNRKYEDGPAVPMTYMNDDHFTYGPWASLWLIRARTEHVGIYTVSVTVRKVDNTTQVYSSSASLAVGSYPPSTTDGLLHLGMFPKAHRDRSEYWIFLFILYCGNFTTRGKPNVRAYLTFPDEESMEMVDYDPMAGQFYVLLNVTSPVGVYSCHLPKEQGAMGCLLYNSSLLARATLNVTSQMKASAIEAALKQEAEEKASEDNN